MSHAARSVFAFGVYMIGEGVMLIVAPALLLSIFGLPPPLDVWVRAAGVALIVLGYYYVQCARIELVPFFRFTVHGRIFQFIAFAAFVAMGWARPVLLLASGFELAAGLWTAFALRGAPAAAPAR